MAANSNQLKVVEGQWEELVQHSDQFAGRRVRVTVLSDNQGTSGSIVNEIRRWLVEGDALHTSPPDAAKPDAFGDGLVDKFRKQGLVL